MNKEIKRNVKPCKDCKVLKGMKKIMHTRSDEDYYWHITKGTWERFKKKWRMDEGAGPYRKGREFEKETDK